MRNRWILVGVSVLAGLLWVGLLIFMNRKPPDTMNQVIFLPWWGAAVALTVMPLAYLLGNKLMSSWGKDRGLMRALRQGVLAGGLAMMLMTLRFMRLLNWPTAIILSLVVVLVEVLLYLRDRG